MYIFNIRKIFILVIIQCHSMFKHITATITKKTFDQLIDQVNKGKYRNRSHAIEEGLKKLFIEESR